MPHPPTSSRRTMPENDASDEGVGPDHVPGCQRGEDLSDPG